MCGLTVTDVFRTVSRWINNGRLAFANQEKTSVMVKDRSGECDNLEISPDYHAELLDFLSADIAMPKYCETQRQFRTLLVAACIATQRKTRPEWERKKDLDRMLKETTLQSVRERAALLGVS